jgi:hypothetical protein
MKDLRTSGPLLLAALLLNVAVFSSRAQAQTNITQAAAKTCAVMSGQRKADGQAIQYLLLLDEDIGEANPVAIALQREVIKQCPKAFVDYQQRKRVQNPFPPGSLVKQNPTQLVNSAPDFAIRCRGTHGMASTDGKNVIVEFRKSDRPADEALQPGQCSWLDRGVGSNEPMRITDGRPSVEEARNTAAHINAGDTWTFWVVNAGTVFRATASAKGTPKQKP